MPTETKLLSRKFIITILGYLIATVLIFMNKLSSQDFLVFIATITGAYHVANVSKSMSSDKEDETTAI